MLLCCWLPVLPNCGRLFLPGVPFPMWANGISNVLKNSVITGNISKMFAAAVRERMRLWQRMRHTVLRSIQQRAAMVLKNVHYVIEAHFDMTAKAAPNDNPGKFCDIIRRRIEKGAFYHQPYFGTREFPVFFAPCESIPPCPEELMGRRDLGFMLWDMDYTRKEDIRPLFFRAVMEDGVLRVPTRDSGEVIG